MTTRRTWLTGVGATLLAKPHLVVAQPAAGKRRVAYLSTTSPGNAPLEQFRSGLRELGWIEGSNLNLDLRFAQGDAARHASLTSELLALRPGVFVSATDFAAVAAAASTKTLPIVFIYGTDPVGRGLVKSLSSPGGNTTGFSVLGVELEPKRLALLLSYGADVPALFKRTAALVDRILRGAKPADLPVEQVNVYELIVNLRTARALGLELPRSLMLQATRVIE